jgi:hypothetical protein
MTYEGRKVLRQIFIDYGVHTLLNGEATGIDTDAKMVAKSLNLNIRSFPAEWEKHGVKAGCLRNAEMAQELELVKSNGVLIIFSGGPGTKDMLKQAIARHIPVINLQDKKYSYEA